MEDCHFYAFSRGPNLLYIGMTYKQYIQDEVKQSIRAFEESKHGLTIWLGYIEKTDFGRITKKIVKDIESLLIRTHEPPYNNHSTSTYTGRDELKVKNRGCPHLEPFIEAKLPYIYY